MGEASTKSGRCRWREAVASHRVVWYHGYKLHPKGANAGPSNVFTSVQHQPLNACYFFQEKGKGRRGPELIDSILEQDGVRRRRMGAEEGQ